MPRITCATRFQRLLDVWQIIKLCRFNLVLPFVVGVFLVFIPNGQEVLLRTEEESTGRLLLFGFMLILWPITVWYWARVILSFEFPDWPPRLTEEERADREALREYRRRHRWILNWQLLMPRLCGVFALLMMLWAVWLESDILERQSGGRGKLIWFVVISILVFVLFVWQRRQMMSWATKKVRGPLASSPADAGGQGPARRPLMFSYHGGQTPAVRFYQTWRELPWITLVILGLSLAVFAVLPFLLFRNAEWAVWSAPKLGSASILLLAASGWTCFGAWIMYVANQSRLPVLLLAFIWVVVVSVKNDNHQVRTEDAAPAMAKDFHDHLHDWLAGRSEETMPTGDKAIPVIVVTAEGGGIRAAYWAASVLSRLEEAYPGFAEHIFAISAVSGGSLGAAVFDALLVESPGNVRATHAGQGSAPAPAMSERARGILRKDFVAPVFAMMLYPDLVQRFLWFPVESWDRSTALETAWERAWVDVVGQQRQPLAEVFDKLWDGENRHTVPGLILNSTSVEEGKRVLFSNIPISNDTDCTVTFKATEHPPFHDVMDLRLTLNADACHNNITRKVAEERFTKTLRLSSAVHNGARFTFVSPPGTVSRNLHVVDGGYFDNSGATTAAELLEGIERFKDPENRRLLPIVIHIANDPQLLEFTGRVVGPFAGGKLRIRGDREPEPGREAPIVTVGIDRFRHPEHVMVARDLEMGDPVTVLVDRDNKVVEFKGAGSFKIRYLSELVAPLVALYHAWGGRSDSAVAALHRKLESPDAGGPVNCGPKPCRKRFFQFSLRAGDAELPVGWTLSDSSWTEMDEQLDSLFFSPRCKKIGEEGAYTFLRRCRPDPEPST